MHRRRCGSSPLLHVVARRRAALLKSRNHQSASCNGLPARCLIGASGPTPDWMEVRSRESVLHRRHRGRHERDEDGGRSWREPSVVSEWSAIGVRGRFRAGARSPPLPGAEGIPQIIRGWQCGSGKYIQVCAKRNFRCVESERRAFTRKRGLRRECKQM